MSVIYTFEPHPFELPITRQQKIKCKVWEAVQSDSSVAVIEYDFGEDLDSQELRDLAEHIVTKYGMSVVAVEYAETRIKYNPQLLKRLEDYLPSHLRICSKYLSERHQKLIEQGAFQDVINDLQYNPYINIPINKETIISLYGDEYSYTDFGVAASLDIICSLEQLKKKYPSWKWNDCIGIGGGYGGYILQMVERFLPNSFSMIIAKNSLVKPDAFDLFGNRTELENGSKEFIYRKNIGKFPLFLNEVQGWTTAQNHPYFFGQRHYDIRNLENDILLQRGNKKTPLIFIEEIETKGAQEKINYVEKLIKHDYSVELFIPDEDEVDDVIVYKEKGTIKTNLLGVFDYYMHKEYNKNLKDSNENRITILPVFNGVYVFSIIDTLPKLFFIPSNKELAVTNEMEYLFGYLNEDLNRLDQHSFNEIIHYVRNPLLSNDEDYKNLFY